MTQFPLNVPIPFATGVLLTKKGLVCEEMKSRVPAFEHAKIVWYVPAGKPLPKIKLSRVILPVLRPSGIVTPESRGLHVEGSAFAAATVRLFCASRVKKSGVLSGDKIKR